MQEVAIMTEGVYSDDLAALHLSAHTVHRHIANVYSALDLGSRAAAVAYAVNRGMI